MLIASTALAVLAVCLSSAAAAKDAVHLPEYVQTCPRDSPHINTCVLKALKNLHPYLIKGIPQLDLPPIDPFKLDEVLMEYHNGQIHAKFGIKDYTLYGLRDLQFQGVRTNFEDLDNFTLQVDVFIPKLKSDGRYKIQGNFIKSEFGGKGTFNVTMSNIKATWSYTGSRVVVDGVTYMRMNHLDMEPDVGDMKIYASNLFNGNEPLSRTALKLFNQYWRLVYRELLPYVKKDWDKIMTDIANKVFMRVPFDEIFPASS